VKEFLFFLVVVVSSVTTHAQGTVSFSNVAPPGQGVNAPVYESDGVTKCSGPQFMAELLVGTTANSLSSLATTGFLTGNGAGYFNGGNLAVPGVFPGQVAWFEVRVWNTASGGSFSQAQASGLQNSWWRSSIFTEPLGGGLINPTPPTPLAGLGNSPVYLNGVPEPCTIALAGLGGALVVFRIRRRGAGGSRVFSGSSPVLKRDLLPQHRPANQSTQAPVSPVPTCPHSSRIRLASMGLLRCWP
jgi:hypothetical protein